jgi:ABC-type dipeptide/oligopeptide/nickel transport system ATPase component
MNDYSVRVVVQRGVFTAVERIQQEQKNTVILVTHDMAVMLILR